MTAEQKFKISLYNTGVGNLIIFRANARLNTFVEIFKIGDDCQQTKKAARAAS